MRVLHLGSGFRPMRRGGLVAYVEDLMREQVRRRHKVSYLFSGRFYPFVGGPRLRRWSRDGVGMLEIVNSPLFDHGRQPELELSEPGIERMLERVLALLNPEVVHVQELAGLPSSVLDVVHSAGVPTVLTLQDYYPLCPTFKLLDSAGSVCLRREVGADCTATVADRPSYPPLLFRSTLRHDVGRLPLPARGRAAIDRIAAVIADHVVGAPPNGSATDFQHRRDVNVERLNRTGRLVAMSSRVAEIYAELGVQPGRLTTIQLTLAHIERLRPRVAGGGLPVTFATLGGFESPEKGAHLLIDVMRRLAGPPSGGRLRLLVFGHVDPALADRVAGLPGVEVRGPFRPDELDEKLDEVDVGLMPSVWEEAYGYAGVELLAKGIPVIANEIGGMTDYVRPGETGWLNRSRSAPELAEIMAGIAGDPRQVVSLNGWIRAHRDSIVKPMHAHADEIDAVYRGLLA